MVVTCRNTYIFYFLLFYMVVKKFILFFLYDQQIHFCPLLLHLYLGCLCFCLGSMLLCLGLAGIYFYAGEPLIPAPVSFAGASHLWWWSREECRSPQPSPPHWRMKSAMIVAGSLIFSAGEGAHSVMEINIKNVKWRNINLQRLLLEYKVNQSNIQLHNP